MGEAAVRSQEVIIQVRGDGGLGQGVALRARRGQLWGSAEMFSLAVII